MSHLPAACEYRVSLFARQDKKQMFLYFSLFFSRTWRAVLEVGTSYFQSYFWLHVVWFIISISTDVDLAQQIRCDFQQLIVHNLFQLLFYAQMLTVSPYPFVNSIFYVVSNL